MTFLWMTSSSKARTKEGAEEAEEAEVLVVDSGEEATAGMEDVAGEGDGHHHTHDQIKYLKINGIMTCTVVEEVQSDVPGGMSAVELESCWLATLILECRIKT